MRCRSRTHHLLYQRQALRIFQRSLGWIISLSLQAERLRIPLSAEMGEEVKAIVPESVLKKQKREEEWALKKKEELDAAKKKRAESRKLIYSRAKQYAKEYQEQVEKVGGKDLPLCKEQYVAFLDSLILGEWEDRMPRRLFRYDVTACETK
ncbi:hypothetical protein S245_023127, partial [Arachis hypogaea]